MRRHGRWVLVGLAILAINGAVIVWRTTSDRPAPQVVRVAGVSHAPPVTAEPPACLAAADRPYFGLLDYQPAPQETSLAVIDGSLVDMLDLLCGCPAEDVAVSAPLKRRSQADIFGGDVVSALLLTDARGDTTVGPNLAPPPMPSSDFPTPRPTGTTEGKSTDDAVKKPSPPPMNDCVYPGMAPSFPWDGGMMMGCPPPCCCAKRCGLLCRLKAWLHHPFHKTCLCDDCCFPCDPCGSCCDRRCGFFHRRQAVTVCPEFWGSDCSPFPIFCNGAVSP